MKLVCSPAISADMNTITATPMATPAMMNTVCSLPSRRKRIATIHSKGRRLANMVEACEVSELRVRVRKQTRMQTLPPREPAPRVPPWSAG